MPGKVVKWNGVDSSIVTDLVIGQVTRQMLGATKSSSIYVPGRAGGIHIPQPPGLRKLSAECYVMSETFSGRGEAVVEVADWLDVDNEAKLEVSDRPGVFYLAALESTPQPYEWRNLGKFDISWIVQPYSYDLVVSSLLWTGDEAHFHTLEPDVSLPVYPVVVIKPTDGTMLSIVLESAAGSLVVNDLNVLSGQSVSINSLVPIVSSGVNYDESLTGAFDPNTIIVHGVSGDFPILMPGTNNWSFIATGTATSFSIDVQYRKTYRK